MFHRAGPIQRTVAAVLLGCAAVVQAPAQEREGLQEIVVTAQKREQSVQDIGIAVTAFSAEQIRELGFTSSTDVVAMTPGLNYTVPNGESSQINLLPARRRGQRLRGREREPGRRIRR